MNDQTTQFLQKAKAFDGAAILDLIRTRSPNKYPVNLEGQYKRIFDRVVMRLGTKDLEHYLNGLMLQEATGEKKFKRNDGISGTGSRYIRQGFPQEVGRELFFISILNSHLLSLAESELNEQVGGSMEMSGGAIFSNFSEDTFYSNLKSSDFLQYLRRVD